MDCLCEKNKRGKLFILCGPSGVGKKTLISHVSQKSYLNLDISISFTTRAKRKGEKEGVDYFFVSREEFIALLKENKVVEYASFFDNYYGTPKQFLEEKLNSGKNVLLEVDVMGFRQVILKYPDAISIFLEPPTIVDLYKRLLKRNTETIEKIKQRIAKAEKELKEKIFFKYSIVNQTVEESSKQLENLIFAEIE